MSRHIAANFSERLLTIAANFFGMVDATIAAIHVIAFAYMRPGLTTYILRVATKLFVYSNTRPVTPRDAPLITGNGTRDLCYDN